MARQLLHLFCFERPQLTQSFFYLQGVCGLRLGLMRFSRMKVLWLLNFELLNLSVGVGYFFRFQLIVPFFFDLLTKLIEVVLPF